MTEQEIITRLLAIEKWQKIKRKRNKIAYYNVGEKIHLKQMEFHRCNKRNRWVFGGNRCGKTECGAVETVWRARGIHPYRDNKDGVFGWVVSLSSQVQRDVAQRKILEYLNPEWIRDIVMVSGKSASPEGGVIDYISVNNVFGGVSVIGFKTCEMGREKFQGTSLDFVWFDEEPPEDIYLECKMRLIDKKGDLYGTMTPLKGRTFLYDTIYLNESNDPQVWYTFMEWADNPYLDSAEIEDLSKVMSNDELQARRYGRFSLEGGLVYPEFNERVHVIEPFPIPKEWYDEISIDPGLNNPLSCHFYAVDYDSNIYVIAEHFAQGMSVKEHCDAIRKICLSLGWRSDGKGRYRALIDSAANQRTLGAEKSVAELFYDNGILVNTRVNKDVFTGINRVKALLNENGGARIRIFSSCVNLIRELKTYAWAEGDRPKKVDDHALDELRYYVMTKPVRSEKPSAPSLIEEDKSRLIRRMRNK
jgi:phage terminase large subunit-like protein